MADPATIRGLYAARRLHTRKLADALGRPSEATWEELLGEVEQLRARILGHPDLADADRCPSCEHSLSRYHDGTGCAFQFRTPRRNWGYQCACGHAHKPAAPVPVEDTDTDGVRYHDDEPVPAPPSNWRQPAPAVPSTVDSSARERIARALADSQHVWWQTPPRLDEAADAVLAALPELAEHPVKLRAAEDEVVQLHGELTQAEAFGLGEFRVTTSAYETACEALERRRVALVEAMGLPDRTPFYVAVGRVAEARAEVERLKARIHEEVADRG